MIHVDMSNVVSVTETDWPDEFIAYQYHLNVINDNISLENDRRSLLLHPRKLTAGGPQNDGLEKVIFRL